MSPLEPIPTYARDDLATAVEVALVRQGYILTAGEAVVARRFLSMSPSASSLYARLFSRTTQVFRLDRLAYADVGNIREAADILIAAGFAMGTGQVPTASLLGTLRVPELKALCRVLGLPTMGSRPDLLARLEVPALRTHLSQRVIVLRHRGLFRRLIRIHLCDHQGDLSRMVIARMGVIRFPDYAPTGGTGIFPDRRALLSYEHALARTGREVDADALAEDAQRAVRAVIASTPVPTWRRRFSARRFEQRRARAAIRAVERTGAIADAAHLYGEMLHAEVGPTGWLARRRALCLAAAGDPAAGAMVCQTHRDRAWKAAAATDGIRTAVDARALERTGRRLARRGGLQWTPLPPLVPPRVEIVSLPDWGDQPVEAVIISLLENRGQKAVHGEGTVWSTLFGMLFRAALFAPVNGMLPTAWMTAPLDFGTEEFAQRRSGIIDEISHRIRSDEAAEILREMAAHHLGEAIVGVRWDLLRVDELTEVVDALGGEGLMAILAPFIAEGGRAAAGLPDLCVLPGPGGVRLIEVKGPGDTLRDAQRIWLDRLMVAGIDVEVWRVRRQAAALAAG